MAKKTYQAPTLETLGAVTDLTQVGQTNPGGDTLPTQAKGREDGSIHPPGRD